MQYKRFITVAISTLFVCAILVAVWLLEHPQYSSKQAVDLTNKVHTEFYQKALSYWDAQLETGPFRENSSTGIRLTWTKPEEVYNHFLITVTDAASGWTQTGSGEHDRVSLDQTGLQPDTKYTFVVRACIDVKCESWMTAEKEAEARTPKMIWKITSENRDLTTFAEMENWQTAVRLPEIILQKEDGTSFSFEEKNTLTIERVTFVKMKGVEDTVMTLKRADHPPIFAVLTNP